MAFPVIEHSIQPVDHSLIAGDAEAVCDERLANYPQWHLIPPKDTNMRIPDNVKKCVAFIGIEAKDHNIKFCGTGFFVRVPPPKIKTASFTYLVTAKHVAVMLSGRRFFVRVNTKDGKSEVFKGDDNVKWWFNPKEDEACDVAVFPLAVSQEMFDKLEIVSLPIEMILTEQQRLSENIGEGDEIVITGLFAHHFGNTKNLPIIRTGNIAMISEEPVPTKKFGEMRVHLIESRSIGGLSGSPVFVLKQVELATWRIHLLGLIHGHWDIDPDKIIDLASEDSGEKGINTGIAMVVPGDKILETINQSKLLDLRTKQEERWIAQNSPKPDSPQSN